MPYQILAPESQNLGRFIGREHSTLHYGVQNRADRLHSQTPCISSSPIHFSNPLFIYTASLFPLSSGLLTSSNHHQNHSPPSSPPHHYQSHFPTSSPSAPTPPSPPTQTSSVSSAN